MERRQLGSTDMQVSVLGFGGAEIGGASLADVERLLGKSLDGGLNVIDTAECYGESEELIGRAVWYRRSDYYLFSKCGHASGFTLPDWSPQLLNMSIDRSLRRLKTDYLDLIQLHGCSKEVLCQEEVIDVLLKARDSGKVRYIGYSGNNADARYAIQMGIFDTLQTSVNIADQSEIERTLPLAQEHNIGVIAKRPLANVVWKSKIAPKNPYHYPYWERLRKLQYAFLTEDLESSVGIALRFTLSVAGVCTAIVGTANPDRYQQNATLLQIRASLTEEQFKAIRSHWKARAPEHWLGLM
ncbi:MAG TPA: aldo/keto reductase [Ktedonobacteraceae bacterium]|nr:aldo/keto reductase [Ktedonobacteraceae bacterium]